jgi:hypothetical protein
VRVAWWMTDEIDVLGLRLGLRSSDQPLARLKCPEVCHRNEPRCIGFTASRKSACFHALTSAFPLRLCSASFTMSSDPSSALLLLRVPSPHVSAPLGFYSELCPFGPGSPATGFRPSSRHHVHAATCAQGTQPHAMVRPQAFAASRRVDPHTRSRACFIPLPRSGLRSFKDFSLHAATLSRRQEPAPLPFLHAPLPGLRPSPRHTNVGSEASIRAKMRSLEPSYSPNPRPLPSSSFAPPGPLPRLSRRLTQLHPLLTLPPRTFAFALAQGVRLQRLLNEDFGNYVSVPTDLHELSNLNPKLRFDVQPRVAALPSSAT